MSITSDRIREYGFIHDLADAAADEIDALEAEIATLQCKIDELMLEYCPDEMTEEQKVEWARHQQPVSDEKQRAVDAAIAAAQKQEK